MPGTPKKKREKKGQRRRRLTSMALNAGLVVLLVVLVLALGGALARIFGLWGAEPGSEHEAAQAAEAAQQLQDIATVSAIPQGTPSPTATPGPPQRMGPVEVSATEVDLGRVPLSRWVTPSFKVRNVGQSPLVMMFGNVETLEGC